MIKRLEKQTSEFAGELLFNLKYRIIERRQIVLSTSLAYLENPAFLNTTSSLNLTYADREDIAKKLTELSTRLFPAPPPPPVAEDDSQNNPDEPELIEEAQPPQRIDSNESEELNTYLNETRPVIQVSKTASTLDIIQEAMSLFETNGERPKPLEKVN